MTLEGRVLGWMLGDAEAAHFAMQAWDAAQQWDDLEDEGRCADANALLAWLAFGMDGNAFFARHAGTLRPALLSVYLQWRAANVLERSDDEGDVERAWMLRAGIYGFWHVMAWCAGGHDHAVRVGPEIWRTYGEALEEFKEEMARCRVQQ